MTALNDLTGTFTLDPTHSEIGFVARHAMVTRVRGAFTEFEGTASTGTEGSAALIDVTVQTASIATGNADRDGHLRSGDFFDVETYPTIRFVSTDVTIPSDDVLRVVGDLTIKDVTRPVTIDFEYEGVAQDPFGNVRVGLSGKVDVNRKDFGLIWNAALETGGVLVSDNVTLAFEVSAIRNVESDASAPVLEDAPTAAEPVAEPAVQPAARRADAAVPAGFVGWIKNLFASSNR